MTLLIRMTALLTSEIPSSADVSIFLSKYDAAAADTFMVGNVSVSAGPPVVPERAPSSALPVELPY